MNLSNLPKFIIAITNSSNIPLIDLLILSPVDLVEILGDLYSCLILGSPLIVPLICSMCFLIILGFLNLLDLKFHLMGLKSNQLDMRG